MQRSFAVKSVNLSSPVHYSAACEIHISFKGLTTLVTFDQNPPTHKELKWTVRDLSKCTRMICDGRTQINVAPCCQNVKKGRRIHRNGGINVALEMHKESNKAVDKCGTPLVKVSACQAPQQCSQNALLFFLRLETAFHRFELYTEPEYVQSSRIRSLARLLHLNLRVNTTS